MAPTVRGIPTVPRTPRRPMFTVAPGTPKLALTPPPLRLRRTPGKSWKECRNRKPMITPKGASVAQPARGRNAGLSPYLPARMRAHDPHRRHESGGIARCLGVLFQE